MERAKLLFQPRQVGAQALIEPLSLAVKWRDQGSNAARQMSASGATYATEDRFPARSWGRSQRAAQGRFGTFGEWPVFAHLRRLTTSRIDVKQTVQTAAVTASVGRRARLQRSPREQTFLFTCSDLVGAPPSDAEAVGPAKRGARAVRIVGAHLDERRNWAQPKGRIRAPIDKVEPTVDTAGP